MGEMFWQQVTHVKLIFHTISLTEEQLKKMRRGEILSEVRDVR